MPQDSQNLHNFAVPMKNWGFWLNAGIALICFMFLPGCTEPVADEQRISQRIEAMLQGTREKSISDVMEPVHQDFLGNKSIRKANLKGLVYLHFQRHKNVHVLINDLEIQLNGDKARVTCNVLLAGRNEALPEQARVLRVSSDWAKHDDDWFVMSASWKDPFLNP